MTYQRFEDIPVWQSAITLAERTFAMTRDRAFLGQGDVANQMQSRFIDLEQYRRGI